MLDGTEEEQRRNINAKADEWKHQKLQEDKLAEIKEIRLQKLQETDFYALQDVSMSNEMKTWRQSLRNIPARPHGLKQNMIYY